MDHVEPRGAALREWATALALEPAHPTTGDSTRNTHLLGGIPTTCIDHIYLDSTLKMQIQHAAVIQVPLLAV